MATFNPSAGEGRTPNDGTGSDSFATVRGATIASTAVDDILILLTSTSGSTFRIHRVFLPFDTSSIGAGSTVLSATLSLYRSDAVTAFNNTDTTSIEIVTQTQASNTSLVTDDYDQVSFTSKGSINLASTSNLAYFTPVSITDLTVISTTSYTKLAILLGRDQANSQPTGVNSIGFQSRGDANPPVLTVTFSTPGGGLMTQSFFM